MHSLFVRQSYFTLAWARIRRGTEPDAVLRFLPETVTLLCCYLAVTSSTSYPIPFACYFPTLYNPGSAVGIVTTLLVV